MMNQILEKEIKNTAEYLKNKIPSGTYMVTGATGKIANFLVKILLRIDKIKVIALCHSYQKGVKAFADYMNYNLVIVARDITEPLEDIYGSIDYVIHLAGICQNWMCRQYPQEVINVNVAGTYHVLEFAKKLKIKKFLFFSSAAVYGRVASELYKEEEFGEIDFRNPQNAYGISKRVGENLCNIYQDSYPVIIVRPFHIIDPYTLSDRDLMLGEFYNKIINAQPVSLNTDGTQKRNFTWIMDAIRMILEVMQQEKGTFNIGNPDGTLSVRETAEIIMKVTEKRSSLRYKDFETEKPSNQFNMIPDLSKVLSVVKNRSCLDISKAIKISMECMEN